MRTRPFILLLFIFVTTATAQSGPAPAGTYRIDKLTLVSADLPRTERQDIARSFEGGTYNLEELAERMRSKLRDAGYALGEVGPAEVVRVRRVQSECAADVRYSVHAGHRYRLSGITFGGETVFPTSQLRALFHIEDGAVFNATELGKGLESLKDLYGSASYANFGAIPKPTFDEAHHTLAIAIDLDPGMPVKFGRLLMQGTEPHAGVASELLASWKELEGKRYNSRLLREWLKKNSINDAPVAPFAQNVAGADAGSLNVLVHFD